MAHKHPGAILRKDFINAHDLSINQVSRDLDINVNNLHKLLRGDLDISVIMAARLATYFRNAPRFWLELQAAYDVQEGVKEAKTLAKTLRVRPLRR